MQRILSNNSSMTSINWSPLFTAIVLIVFGALPLFGQTEGRIDCGSVAKLSKPKSNRIVSLGVINGKAIDLVKPEFPAAARAVNVHGSVEISVLIDTRGCVSEAKVLTGHPLLVPSSLRAASKSTFSPTTVSGNRIWVYGIITYNYLPDTLNWFELGLVCDSTEKLIEYLPSGFDIQRNQLRNAKSLPYDERQNAMPGMLDRIHVELSGEPKRQWLFDVGRKINDISKFNWTGPDGLKEQIQQLRRFLEVAPQDVSPTLVSELRQLIGEADSTRFWKRIKEIESRSFHLGK